jgi:hypothetical protein
MGRNSDREPFTVTERGHVNAQRDVDKPGDGADKAKVMAAHRKLLETRYVMTPKLDPAVAMSRGKALPVGRTARLASGLGWEELAKLSPEEIKRRGVFPYPRFLIPSM